MPRTLLAQSRLSLGEIVKLHRQLKKLSAAFDLVRARGESSTRAEQRSHGRSLEKSSVPIATRTAAACVGSLLSMLALPAYAHINMSGALMSRGGPEELPVRLQAR